MKILFFLIIFLLAFGSTGAWVAQYLESYDLCSMVTPETPRELEQRELITTLEDELTQQQELNAALTQRLEERVDRIHRLTEIYANMAVSTVAEVITQLDPQIASRVLENMDPGLVGQILNLLPPEQTVIYSRILSGE